MTKPDPKKRHVSLRVNIETYRRVEKKFSRPDETAANDDGEVKDWEAQ